MTPILYDSTETAFTSNGIGRLAEARKCEVTEVRNGEYELALEYPINGKLLGSIICGNFIKATHDNTVKAQPFQIYEVSEPIKGFVTVRAWHISYALNAIVVKPFTATSCADAISKISTNAIGTCPFTFWTDKSVTANFNNSVPKSIRSLLGGSEGSILDTYGKGEYEFDGFDVKLWLNRGVNRGVKIKYGKNLLSLDRQLDASNVYNAVVPFWTNDETTVSLDHAVVRTGETAGRTIPLDLSGEWDEAPTTTQLENKAQAHVDATSNYELKENLKVSFVQLWQTEEYKDIANLERINLCDTVTIEYLRRGITATAKCIKVVYDTLRERYVSMELGEPRTSLAQQINTDVVQPAVAMLPDRASVKGAIDRATELISGGFGGYIKYKYLVDGTPSEMLIMDSASEATATNIIRLNQNGIGFSTDGGATYANAWTIDGHLNADFITAGTMVANRVRAGLLTDETGDNSWNLDTGELVTKSGEIGGFTIDTTGLKTGDIDGVGQSGSSILPTGIVFNAGAFWRAILTDRLTFQTKIGGSWTDAVVFALSATGSDKPIAIIYAEGGPVAEFGAVGNQLSTYDATEYNHLLIGSLRVGNNLLAKYLHAESGGSISIGSTAITETKLAALSENVFAGRSVSSGNPLVLTVGNGTGYWGGIVCGLVQNVGAVLLGLTCDGSTVTARDLMNNSSWTSSALAFSISGSNLTISSNQANVSYISLFIG